MKPMAFVIPWYGDNIKGGAENECNHLAHCFLEEGISVEVLTTCVKEASDDRGMNTLPQGETLESGVKVRRFPVRKRNVERFNQANIKLYRNEKVTIQEELAYLEEDINSPELYSYIRKNRDNYQMFIFMPYLYGPTYFGSKECPENAVIIPCLHDEGYAYMSLMKERMQCFKKMIFLSKPESDLAHSLYNLEKVENTVLGAYVESGWEKTASADDFRNKYGIKEDFILCAGRKEPGKKTDLLVQYFCKFKEKHPKENLKLVFIGGGKVDIPTDYTQDIIDLGFVDLQDKHNALKAAYVLCNPSFFESFSIVIMESWLAGRPVLVSEQCKVTTNFCNESNGGLYFSSYILFEACVKYLLENREIADGMGSNGKKFVNEHFVKDVISHKYLEFLMK